VLVRGLAAAVLAVLVFPGAASAGTASVLRNVLRFHAATGEANTVAVVASGSDFLIVDTGAPVTPGVGCTARTASVVECDGAGVERLFVSLGDGADEVANSTALVAVLRGGDGNDRLLGGFVGNELHGEAGDDVLEGGPGDDLVVGGIGADEIHGDPIGMDPDRGGLDLTSYKFRTNGVRVRPGTAADDGEPGEGDTVFPDVEIVEGGRGDDRLTMANTFFGGLIGGPGDDVLKGTTSYEFLEVLLGGPGRDIVLSGPTDAIAAGGSGNDFVRGAGGADTMWGDRGSDELVGRKGADTLYGGLGHDVLEGNGGPDVLAAHDRRRDRVFGGGGDRDRAFIDSHLDLTVGVERFPAGDVPRNARPAARLGAFRALYRTLRPR
jgi:Ca2+-binding RTX toxin-like protein